MVLSMVKTYSFDQLVFNTVYKASSNRVKNVQPQLILHIYTLFMCMISTSQGLRNVPKLVTSRRLNSFQALHKKIINNRVLFRVFCSS